MILDEDLSYSLVSQTRDLAHSSFFWSFCFLAGLSSNAKDALNEFSYNSKIIKDRPYRQITMILKSMKWIWCITSALATVYFILQISSPLASIITPLLSLYMTDYIDHLEEHPIHIRFILSLAVTSIFIKLMANKASAYIIVGAFSGTYSLCKSLGLNKPIHTTSCELLNMLSKMSLCHFTGYNNKLGFTISQIDTPEHCSIKSSLRHLMYKFH